jgi:hypothetical protein
VHKTHYAPTQVVLTPPVGTTVFLLRPAPPTLPLIVPEQLTILIPFIKEEQQIPFLKGIAAVVERPRTILRIQQFRVPHSTSVLIYQRKMELLPLFHIVRV